MWIFGTGQIGSELSRVAHYYWKHYKQETNIKFVVDEKFAPKDFSGRTSEDLLAAAKFVEDKKIFIPVGYKNLNKDREAITNKFKEAGFEILDLICSQRSDIHLDVKRGKGVWIQEDCRLQTGSSISDGCVLWAGFHLGHLASLGKYVWGTTGAVVCSSAIVKDYVFLGANCVIGPEITVGTGSIVSSLANLTKSVPDFSVVGAGHNNILDKDSREIKMK